MLALRICLTILVVLFIVSALISVEDNPKIKRRLLAIAGICILMAASSCIAAIWTV